MFYLLINLVNVESAVASVKNTGKHFKTIEPMFF
jgi:hypothetical protein